MSDRGPPRRYLGDHVSGDSPRWVQALEERRRAEANQTRDDLAWFGYSVGLVLVVVGVAVICLLASR